MVFPEIKPRGEQHTLFAAVVRSAMLPTLLAFFFLIFANGNCSAKEITLSWECRLEVDYQTGGSRNYSLKFGIDDQAYREAIQRGIDEEKGTFAGLVCAYRESHKWVRDEIAWKLWDGTKNLSLRDRMEVVLNFVSSLPYKERSTMAQPPIQTLYEGCGDCDDKAMLAIWIIAGLGHLGNDVRAGLVLAQAVTDPNMGHAGVALRLDPPVGSDWSIVKIEGETWILTDVTSPGTCRLGDWKRDIYPEVGIIVPPRTAPYLLTLNE